MSGIKFSRNGLLGLKNQLRKIPKANANGSQSRVIKLADFWGSITGWAVVSGKTLFSWSGQRLKNTASFDDLDPSIDATSNALPIALIDAVRIQLIGYDTSGNPVYGFIRSPNFPCRVTAVAANFPVWTYTIQRVIAHDTTKTDHTQWVTDGVNLTMKNRLEWVPASYPFTHGTGVTVTSSDGTVNSGPCKIKSIPVGACPDVSVDYSADGTDVYSCCFPNSAQ